MANISCGMANAPYGNQVLLRRLTVQCRRPTARRTLIFSPGWTASLRVRVLPSALLASA